MMNSVIKSLEIDNAEFVLIQIDKIDKQGEDAVKSEMNKFVGKDKIVKLFKILEKPVSFFKKYEGYKELKQLIDLCKIYNFEPKFNPKLARGLSYYTGTVLEAKIKGMKETICGGGAFSINGIQSFGFGMGLERLSQLTKIKTNEKKILIISIGQDEKSINLAEKLRKQGKQVSVSDKISKALEYANSYNYNFTIFIGSEEVKKKKFKLRDMKSGNEEMLGEKEILERLIN